MESVKIKKKHKTTSVIDLPIVQNPVSNCWSIRLVKGCTVEPVLKDQSTITNMVSWEIGGLKWQRHLHWNVGPSAKTSGPSRQVVSHGSGLSIQVSLHLSNHTDWGI